MNIRLCNPTDTESVTALYKQVCQDLDAGFNGPRWHWPDYPGPAFVQEKIRKGELYLCEEGGRVLGAFVLNADPQGAYDRFVWKTPVPFVVIHTLASAAAGCGSFMVKWIQDRHPSIRLDVVPDNVPAIRLYEKCGFSYVDTGDLLKNIPDIPEFALYEWTA